MDNRKPYNSNQFWFDYSADVDEKGRGLVGHYWGDHYGGAEVMINRYRIFNDKPNIWDIDVFAGSLSILPH